MNEPSVQLGGHQRVRGALRGRSAGLLDALELGFERGRQIGDGVAERQKPVGHHLGAALLGLLELVDCSHDVVLAPFLHL